MNQPAIQAAHWQCDENGRIYALDFGDVYASRSGAWGQAAAVFVAGCELPRRWPERRCIRLLETGFGLGVNFLATWADLRAAGGNTRLQYVAIEKHPFAAADLRSALQASLASVPAAEAARLQLLADQLLSQWPLLLPGFHAIELDEQVTLTLVFGDIADALPQIAGRFDAFYLDGFAPDRNPAMWSPAVLQQLASRAAPDARLSSWCVAGAVRRALAEAGFSVEKRPGYGGKRDSLYARWPAAADTAVPTKLPASAIVIGAGVAGASAARQLARRGIPVTVLERDRPASGGSGNPVGVVRPEPGGAANPITGLSAAGASWLQRWIGRHAAAVRHDWCGVIRIARDERQRDRLAAQAGSLPIEWLQPLDQAAVAAVCGAPPADAGFHLPEAGWVAPATLVSAQLDHPLIRVQAAAAVAGLAPREDGWQVTLADGSVLDAPLVVLATAFDAGLGPVRMKMGRARGQLSCLAQQEGRTLQKIVCRDGYITPAVDGMHTVGATVQHDDEEMAARTADDAQNFERLQRLLPGFAGAATDLQSGRVGWRATTQDRVPLVGTLAEGLYATLGHGARGITCAPLCAEFLAAMICDEPLPLGADWVARLDPLRMAVD